MPPAKDVALLKTCGNCGHDVMAHALDDLAVGDCGASLTQHPEMVWRMRCHSIRPTPEGVKACVCYSYVPQGGTTQPASHPG